MHAIRDSYLTFARSHTVKHGLEITLQWFLKTVDKRAETEHDASSWALTWNNWKCLRSFSYITFFLKVTLDVYGALALSPFFSS
jgi:hypothetical protein